MKEGGRGHLLNPIPNMTKLEEKEKKEERKSSTLGGWMGDNSMQQQQHPVLELPKRKGSLLRGHKGEKCKLKMMQQRRAWRRREPPIHLGEGEQDPS